eukprot:sb/3474508/
MVRQDLYKASRDCQERGLWEYLNWITEQLVHLPKPTSGKVELPRERSVWNEDYDVIQFTLQLMRGQEYYRASQMLKGCETQHGKFLYYYCRFLHGEKKRIDQFDIKNKRDLKNESLFNLRIELEELRRNKKLDTYG